MNDCPKCGGSGGGDDPATRCRMCDGVGMMLELPDFPSRKRQLDPAEELEEKSYRRGFDQGVAAALEAFEGNYSMSQIRAWKNRLSAWRRKSCKSVVYPEWLART